MNDFGAIYNSSTGNAVSEHDNRQVPCPASSFSSSSSFLVWPPPPAGFLLTWPEAMLIASNHARSSLKRKQAPNAAQQTPSTLIRRVRSASDEAPLTHGASASGRCKRRRRTRTNGFKGKPMDTDETDVITKGVAEIAIDEEPPFSADTASARTGAALAFVHRACNL